MKLPKLEFPKYELLLPFANTVVEYRPYSHKEEKILMMAASSDEPAEAMQAIIQVIENCCTVTCTDLHPLDFESVYIALRIASVSPVLDVTMANTCDCDIEGKPDELDGRVDLKTVEYRGMEDLKNNGYVNKNGTWIMMLTDQIGIQFKEQKKSFEDVDPIYDNIKAIFDGQNVTDIADVSHEELIAFIDGLPARIADKIKGFFDYQPYTVGHAYSVCKCGKKQHLEVKGILNFFA